MYKILVNKPKFSIRVVGWTNDYFNQKEAGISVSQLFGAISIRFCFWWVNVIITIGTVCAPG